MHGNVLSDIGVAAVLELVLLGQLSGPVLGAPRQLPGLSQATGSVAGPVLVVSFKGIPLECPEVGG